MRLVAISDTHGVHRRVSLPAGDVLVHSGDLTLNGERSVTLDFVDWFSDQPFKHKIFIAGNHDTWVESNNDTLQQYAMDRGVHYLQGSSIVLDDMTFWGSPYTPRFMDWSFMLSSADEAICHWQNMPETVDVLITHGPPFGVLDKLVVVNSDTGVNNTDKLDGIFLNEENVGCRELFARVREVAPKLHLFGHIHEGYGEIDKWGTRFINVSTMNRDYHITNQPYVIDVTKISKPVTVTAPNDKTFSTNESSFA